MQGLLGLSTTKIEKRFDTTLWLILPSSGWRRTLGTLPPLRTFDVPLLDEIQLGVTSLNFGGVVCLLILLL